MSTRLPISDLTSRFACCTPGVLDACARAVAAEAGLEDVIPGFSERDVALVAKDMLEAYTLVADADEHTFEKARTSGDWALTVLAEVLTHSARNCRDRELIKESQSAWELAESAIAAAAASNDRSPVLWYEDIYFEAAQWLAKNGNRLGLLCQIECLAEGLRSNGGSSAINGLRDLALVQLQLGDYQRGLGLLGSVLRNEPTNIWTYDVIAQMCGRYGLRSIACLAAERGLGLLEQQGDPERLSKQLRELCAQNRAPDDLTNVPLDAVEDLRERLSQGFEGGEHLAPAVLAQKLVPEVATARVKELPPMPDAGSLAMIAADLRAAFRDARSRVAPSPAIGAPVDAPFRPVVARRDMPQVGRNEPCACGSGRKFKKCCGNPATST